MGGQKRMISNFPQVAPGQRDGEIIWKITCEIQCAY